MKKKTNITEDYQIYRQNIAIKMSGTFCYQQKYLFLSLGEIFLIGL